MTLIVIYQIFPNWILIAENSVVKKIGGFEKETIALDGSSYYYLDNHREDSPTLVFLHGFSDRKESWLPFVNPLSKDYHIIIPDLKGHGDNPKDFNTSHDFVSQAAYVNELVSKLNIDSFDLIGISMGGGVAGQFAAHYKDKTKSLTLISTAGINDYSIPSKMDSLMITLPSIEEKKDVFPLLPHKVTKSSLAQFKSYIFYKNIYIPKKLFNSYLKNSLDNRDFYIKVLEDFFEVDSNKFKTPLNTALPEIECPINVIWGKQDPLLSVSCVNVIDSILTVKPTITVIDECGHATIAEKPKQTLKAITDFFSESK